MLTFFTEESDSLEWHRFWAGHFANPWGKMAQNRSSRPSLADSRREAGAIWSISGPEGQREFSGAGSSFYDHFMEKPDYNSRKFTQLFTWGLQQGRGKLLGQCGASAWIVTEEIKTLIICRLTRNTQKPNSTDSSVYTWLKRLGRTRLKKNNFSDVFGLWTFFHPMLMWTHWKTKAEHV